MNDEKCVLLAEKKLSMILFLHYRRHYLTVNYSVNNTTTSEIMQGNYKQSYLKAISLNFSLNRKTNRK